MRQVSPVCRRIGVFSVAAKRGTNKVRVPKRIGGHRLGVGTYILTGKNRWGARLFQVHARIARGRTLVLHRGGTAGTCESARATTSIGYFSAAAPAQTPAPPTDGHGVKGRSASSPLKPQPEPSGPLSPHSPIVRAISLDYAPDPLRPLLLALLAVAIALLGAAALPQRVLPAGPAAAFVAERRGYIVAVGVWLLAVVAVVTTFA